MSKVETNTIDTVSGSSTMQIGSTNTATINLGVSGDTINVPAGVTIANAGTSTGFGLTNWSESSGNLLATNASYGIYLGVNSATAANLLNDYEEGSWTPTISGASSGPTYDNRTGRYTKTGDLVFVEMLLQWNSTSYTTASDAFTVTGLPFTPINIHYNGAPGSVVTGASFNWNNTQSTSTTASIAASANESSAIVLLVGASTENFSGSKIKNDNNGQGIVSVAMSYRTTA